MMPIEVENPSSRARVLMVRASSGFLMPPPSTELMLTSKVGVLAQVLQLLVEQPQALLRHLVRLDVVDADLQEVEAGVVQLLDPLRDQEIAVGDEPGHHAVADGCGG